ncbi:MAG: serine protease [Verrucomicrobiae bacterium]|nr:serine protease [Verrucomicrobiae bacterium]NNJ87445.1 trypsin-like peptidase domain-containing protein [Akkermansiaceae bacterium]
MFMLLGVAGTQARESPWFVDKKLVYERGSRLSMQYLESNTPQFEKKLKHILPWVVRIEVQHSITEDGFTSNHGTGVILKGGKVITAKHVLTKNVEDLKAKTRILLTTTHGRVLQARVIQQGKNDWMVLQIKATAENKDILESPITLSTPRQGETAVFFGYPARLGLDQHGKVQSFHKGNPKKNIPVSQLNPMVVVCSVADAKKVTLNPLAGFPPVGGMSGGPVFNLKGEVIAVQHSVTTTTEDATGRVLRYSIDASPAGAISPNSMR